MQSISRTRNNLYCACSRLSDDWVSEGVDGLVCTRHESFQHTLSYHEILQFLGACEANADRADTMVGHFGDVWRHNALTHSPSCSLSLGAR